MSDVSTFHENKNVLPYCKLYRVKTELRNRKFLFGAIISDKKLVLITSQIENNLAVLIERYSIGLWSFALYCLNVKINS